MTKSDEVKKRSVGRWTAIFRALGIRVREDGKHGPCPVCGGVDRHRYDDRDGRGTSICNQCGAFDGFLLVQKVLGVNFPDAVRAVGEVVGGCDQVVIPREPGLSRELMRKIYCESRPASRKNQVGNYLKQRGLSLVPDVLRYHPACWESETKRNHPAMLAVITSPDNVALTMHRTYLGPQGKADIVSPKKILPCCDGATMMGGAIRLFPAEKGKIAIAEGIETAIAVVESAHIPCWAACSAGMMAGFIPPKGITDVIIFSDNDRNFTGQKAAYTLANRLILHNKISVSVYVPSRPGTDLLDEFVAEKGKFKVS